MKGLYTNMCFIFSFYSLSILCAWDLYACEKKKLFFFFSRLLYLFDFIFHSRLWTAFMDSIHLRLLNAFSFHCCPFFFFAHILQCDCVFVCVTPSFYKYMIIVNLLARIHNDQVYTHHFIHIYFWMLALAAGWKTGKYALLDYNRPDRATFSRTFGCCVCVCVFFSFLFSSNLLSPFPATFNISWSLYDSSFSSFSWILFHFSHFFSGTESYGCENHSCPFSRRHIIWWWYIVITLSPVWKLQWKRIPELKFRQNYSKQRCVSERGKTLEIRIHLLKIFRTHLYLDKRYKTNLNGKNTFSNHFLFIGCVCVVRAIISIFTFSVVQHFIHPDGRLFNQMNFIRRHDEKKCCS